MSARDHVNRFQKIHRWWLKPQCDLSIWPGAFSISERLANFHAYLNVWIYYGEYRIENWMSFYVGKVHHMTMLEAYEKANKVLTEEKGFSCTLFNVKEVKRFSQMNNEPDIALDVLFNIPIEQMLTHENESIRFYSVQRIKAQEKLKDVPQQSAQQTRWDREVLGSQAR
jgi:hypothetical protein